MRATSVAAYHEIVAKGLLPKARLRAYTDVYDNGPVTSRELEDRTGDPNGHRRLRDLADLGVIEEVGTRVCRITGMEVIAWSVNGNLPSGRVQTVTGPPRPRKAELEEVVGILRKVYRSQQVPSEGLAAVGKWLAYQAKRAKR
jgi:hypothetical protein